MIKNYNSEILEQLINHIIKECSNRSSNCKTLHLSAEESGTIYNKSINIWYDDNY